MPTDEPANGPPPPVSARERDRTVNLAADGEEAGEERPAAADDARHAVTEADLPPCGPPLTLRVVGTPFAYVAAPHQECVRIGRQRRKPGETPDEGNDFVVRVDGADALTVRISRRHLELRRDGPRVLAIDRSKAGTLRNGRPLPRDRGAPLADGDRLTLAGVVVLQVLLRRDPAARPAPPLVSAPAPGVKAPVSLEASLGDLVTMP